MLRLNMIESYSFGKMLINGEKFTSDLIIFRDNIDSSWWRQKGHEICVADIHAAVEKYQPQVFIFGTGKFGLVKILPETEKYLTSKEIKFLRYKTDTAWQKYKKLSEQELVMGAFHLTC